MSAPVIFVCGRTIALRRHVTTRAATFGTRQAANGQRKPVNDVDRGALRPSRGRQLFLEELFDAPHMRRLADKTPPGTPRWKPRGPLAPARVPNLLLRVDA